VSVGVTGRVVLVVLGEGVITGFWPQGTPAMAWARQSVADVRSVATLVLASARLPSGVPVLTTSWT
jgi:hypothetical protein